MHATLLDSTRRWVSMLFDATRRIVAMARATPRRAACAMLAAAATLPLARAGEPQILWQRSLDDALALAKEEKRPILIAVNMDGESASERIVRENYRDPAFVNATRPFVCLVASVFRHTPRDYDEQGRRIPCPRLGEVTCGEHIALEPILYDKYLQGDRIAPRHALILQDGTKSFDLSLLFDLRDIDKKLAESAHFAPPVVMRPHAAIDAATIAAENDSKRRIELWSTLASARDQRGRSAFEDALLPVSAEAPLRESLEGIRLAGDAGSLGALRILLPKAEACSDAFVDQLALTAQDLKISAPVAAAAREKIGGLGPFPGSPEIGDDAKLLPLVAHLDGTSPSTLSLLIAHYRIDVWSQEYYRTSSPEAVKALRLVVGPDKLKMESFGHDQDEPLNLLQLLRFAEAASLRLQPIAKPSEDMPPAEALERELEDLDRAMKSKPQDVDLMQRYGIASLNLARRRIESKGPGAQFLLQDAANWLGRVAQSHESWRVDIELARTAFFSGKFEDEARYGERALHRVYDKLAIGPQAKDLLRDLKASYAAWPDSELIELASKLLEDREAVEAMRWIGDGNARLLGDRSGADFGQEMRGIERGAETLALVAVSLSSDETDWTSLGSFFGALGMNREELACLQQGALRLPESVALRTSLNGALWSGGRIDLAPAKAEWILSHHPDSADSMWFAGYAHMLGAEDHRRREEQDGAIEAYRNAEIRFKQSVEKKPEYEASATHYLAMCALGRGFAHLLADRRDQAAECLAQGVAIEPAVVGARDGLDREAIDLLDGALEWRVSGTSTVDPMAFLDALEIADPKNALWARAVSDSELREALRADGRADEKEGDRYLDVSIAAARRAIDIADDETNRRPLAQSLTIDGERRLKRGDLAHAKKLLAEAALLMRETVPTADAGAESYQALADALRAKLGAARPVFRPGR
jgi:hypothetical protein